MLTTGDLQAAGSQAFRSDPGSAGTLARSGPTTRARMNGPNKRREVKIMQYVYISVYCYTFYFIFFWPLHFNNNVIFNGGY